MTFAQVAELVDAHVSGACAARRAGSSPVLGTFFKKKRSSFAEIAQLVEHNLDKVGVASSSLVFRSKVKSTSFRRGAFFLPCGVEDEEVKAHPINKWEEVKHEY